MKYLLEHLHLHPALQVEDTAKFCYQAVFGAEHLLSDIERAKEYLRNEFEITPATDAPLYENISDEYCRVNIGAWKMRGFSMDDLFALFLQTANSANNATSKDLEIKLQEVTRLAENNALPFSFSRWETFLPAYNRQPLHHSETYRNAEKPAYRVVLRRLVELSALYR